MSSSTSSSSSSSSSSMSGVTFVKVVALYAGYVAVVVERKVTRNAALLQRSVSLVVEVEQLELVIWVHHRRHR
jgi:hypothetical protein